MDLISHLSTECRLLLKLGISELHLKVLLGYELVVSVKLIQDLAKLDPESVILGQLLCPLLLLRIHLCGDVIDGRRELQLDLLPVLDILLLPLLACLHLNILDSEYPPFWPRHAGLLPGSHLQNLSVFSLQLPAEFLQSVSQLIGLPQLGLNCKPGR